MKDLGQVYRDLSTYLGMLHSAQRIGMWGFGRDGTMYYSSCPESSEFLMFLKMSGGLDDVLSPERDKAKPVLLCDEIGLVYLADFIDREESAVSLVLLGPVFTYEFSLRGIDDSLRRMNFSVSTYRHLIRTLEAVPVVGMGMLECYGAMLRYLITGETVLDYEMSYQSVGMKKGIGYREQTYRQGLWPHEGKGELSGNGRMVEERLLLAVEQGDTGFSFDDCINADKAMNQSYYLQSGQRAGRDVLIVFNALCARAAIRGGLSPKKAEEMELHYLNQIEQMNTIQELRLLNRVLFSDYVEQVHDCQNHPEVSEAIWDCCDYIQRNLLSDFTLQDVAKQVGYTEYYLTRKFKKELGIGFHDYIKKCRVDLARIWLHTTDKSIQQISDELNFSTRNYFSKIFTRQVGVSPAAYRRQLAGGMGEKQKE